MGKLKPFVIKALDEFLSYDDDWQFDFFNRHCEGVTTEFVNIEKNYDNTWKRKEVRRDDEVQSGYSIASSNDYKNFKDCLTDEEFWALVYIYLDEEGICFDFYVDELMSEIVEEESVSIEELIQFCKEAIKELSDTENPDTDVYKRGDTTVNALKEILKYNKDSIFNRATEKEKNWLEKFLVENY